MKELQKVLDRAYKTISVLSVSGDQVEVMAQARELLRTAYKLAGDEEENADG